MNSCKPSGTLSILAGATPGIHPAYARYFIRRIRMSSHDPLVDFCRSSGYKVEYARNFDGTISRDTMVIEFPCYAGEATITAAEMTAIDQLDLVKRLQTVWSDNAISVTVYFKPDELPAIKAWLSDNYEKYIKSVSFLRHSEHGFDQAPYEEVEPELYQQLASHVLKTKFNDESNELLSLDDCENGVCPIR